MLDNYGDRTFEEMFSVLDIIDAFLSVLHILDHSRGPNIWYVFIGIDILDFICFRYVGQWWGTEHLMRVIYFTYIGQLCEPNNWWIFICFRYTGQLWWSEHLMCLTILDILDNSGDRTFDTFYLFWYTFQLCGTQHFLGFYLFQIYWTIVGTEHLMGFFCFTYTAQLWWTEHLIRFYLYRYTGQLWGTYDLIHFICFKYTEQLWGPNIWCVFICFRYTG